MHAGGADLAQVPREPYIENSASDAESFLVDYAQAVGKQCAVEKFP